MRIVKYFHHIYINIYNIHPSIYIEREKERGREGEREYFDKCLLNIFKTNQIEIFFIQILVYV